jgi:hypothetical protein
VRQMRRERQIELTTQDQLRVIRVDPLQP